MTRRDALILCAALGAGCGTTFEGERERLKDVPSISDPTLDPPERRREPAKRGATAADRPRLALEARRNDVARTQEEIDELMTQGRKCAERGNWGPAMMNYRMVVEMYPGTPEAKVAAATIRRIEDKLSPDRARRAPSNVRARGSSRPNR